MDDDALSKIYVLAESRGFSVLVSDDVPPDRRPILYYEVWRDRAKAARRARELAMKSASFIRRLALDLNPELLDLTPIIAATARVA
jgi:hypothetical protein